MTRGDVALLATLTSEPLMCVVWRRTLQSKKYCKHSPLNLVFLNDGEYLPSTRQVVAQLLSDTVWQGEKLTKKAVNEQCSPSKSFSNSMTVFVEFFRCTGESAYCPRQFSKAAWWHKRVENSEHNTSRAYNTLVPDEYPREDWVGVPHQKFWGNRNI